MDYFQMIFWVADFISFFEIFKNKMVDPKESNLLSLFTKNVLNSSKWTVSKASCKKTLPLLLQTNFITLN